jgi:signal peptidase II
MPRLGRWIALVVLVGTTFGCDRVTKHFAAVSLAGRAGESFFGDTVRLEYAENRGAFLSLGDSLPPAVRTSVFSCGTALVLIGTVVMAIRLRWSGSPLVGLALVFAGGASNLLDRVARGSVIDFMNVGVGPVRTGIFNVADVAIMAGVALLILTRARGASPSAGSEDQASI